MSKNYALGRLGAQGMIRVLSGVITTAYRDVDSNAEFTAGTVVKFSADSNGVAVVTPVTAKADAALGIAYQDKATAFYVPVVGEVVTPNASFVGTLDFANIDAASVLIAGGHVVTTDYTINATNGLITGVSTAFKALTSYSISYRYKDIDKGAIDQTIGSGKVSVIEGKGEISTLIYDTAAAFTLGGSVYFTTAGIPTANGTAGTHTVIGTVSKVPSADNAELHIKVSL